MILTTAQRDEIKAKVEPIEGWCGPEKVALLADLVCCYQPRSIVEVGVFAGKSLCAFGLALQAVGSGFICGIDSWSVDDVIESIDDEAGKQWWRGLAEDGRLAERRAQAYAWIRTLGIQRHAGILEASADVCASLFRGLDMLHLDSTKSTGAFFDEVERWAPMLRIGGLLIVDDVDWASARLGMVELRRSFRELIEVWPKTDHSAFGVYVREK